MIRQAKEQDIPVLEEILLDAVDWLAEIGLPNQWTASTIQWSNLSKSYHIEDFYIAYYHETPAACMALIDYDPVYWPDLSKGDALYLHKVAVKRTFAGKGISKELIDYAKELALRSGKNTLHLNCNQHRDKLRAVYEREGFLCIDEKTFHGNHDTALYLYNLN